ASGLNQNYFRDYEAATGRYGQSDPIGLEAGSSTYSYVGSSPQVNVDPTGLAHLVGFSVPRQTQVLLALADAREKIRRCDMGQCYEGLEDYFMNSSDREHILEKLNTMTVVYNPGLMAGLA
ncbi:RHS repeat-associated core domain-containing protein, partial [Xanthomonas citri]|uniref:RHS repeat-associated core domain-containing protein n=1 Tax=Xanthomonas citri TaxID=346 RepID=UPI0030C80066